MQRMSLGVLRSQSALRENVQIYECAYTVSNEVNVVFIRNHKVLIVVACAWQKVLELLILTDHIYFKIYSFLASSSVCQLFPFQDKLWGDRFPYIIFKILHIQNVSKLNDLNPPTNRKFIIYTYNIYILFIYLFIQ
jgi:hypothetical protein